MNLPSTMRRCLSAFGVWTLLAGQAIAQVPFVPAEFYNTIRPDFGNRLPLCVLPDSATLEQDRQAARSIARMLLLEPDIVEIDADMGMLDELGIWPVIFEELAESCVGVLGVQIIPGEVAPDWMTLSQPYFEAPYVLLTRDPAVETLADLPAGTRLGVPLYTPIDTEVMTMIAAGGEFSELRRLPYDRPELMTELMRNGEFDAAIVWSPHLDLAQVQPLDFFASQASVAPLRQDTRAVAVLMRTQDQMLRTMIDQAIDAAGAQTP
ncbi:substrate-binding periplasmic protein [Pelagibacterium halotolerans]|uniref:ABC-type amino acid transport/signal transduction systems, periplasmic component/domain protein n=1 Tax=Pelagibacterium halotolerans (strain DSM 22347 / JCM 15775 / CGMCC 1.7692 / B2) TaxID=1082931 RepID=G4R7V2_PELHB|nr:transporter substrate-binding domain-containing protein [Pelagibacterium halotolerans]AEQ50247.1 ABC-type amino acid transport/signal transduction systems, periplasmic component/domain protein [Pelagibacterium halotolerans B2]QJR19758.1 transporter substrate-binding domain-containing protein [Pelagibacterium halotolerans]SEA51823.1 extracellular solute-binding protein, family 3 [Pelagibacterium halotolerans]